MHSRGVGNSNKGLGLTECWLCTLSVLKRELLDARFLIPVVPVAPVLPVEVRDITMVACQRPEGQGHEGLQVSQTCNW